MHILSFVEMKFQEHWPSHFIVESEKHALAKPDAVYTNITPYHNGIVFCLIWPLIHFKLIFCNSFSVDEPKSHVYFEWAYETPSLSVAFVGTKDFFFRCICFVFVDKFFPEGRKRNRRFEWHSPRFAVSLILCKQRSCFTHFAWIIFRYIFFDFGEGGGVLSKKLRENCLWSTPKAHTMSGENVNLMNLQIITNYTVCTQSK